jgi:hypothetical protein
MQEQSSSISNFKRFLTRILLPLILILGAAGLIFNYFFEKEIILKSDICGAYKVNRIINENHSGEIPVFGSSRAAFGFIPDSLGSDYFNYGMAGTKTDVMLFFLEQECKKMKNTPWIILNFDLDGLAYGLGDISNYILNANDPDVKKLLGSEYRPEFTISFIKYYGRYENYLRSYLNDRIDLTKVTDKGAALEKNAFPQKEFDQLVTERKNSPTTFINDSTLQKQLLNVINTHPNRYFVFVVSPYHSSYFEKFTNLDEAHAFLNRLSSLKNVKVFDFSKMPLPDSMFLNTTHINYKGALIFNHRLKDSLISIGVH